MESEFNVFEEKNWGRARFFDLKSHIKTVESLIRSDEIIMALKLCDMIPAWYRDHYPVELLNLKKLIYKRTSDVITYATDDDEASKERSFGENQWGTSYTHPRDQIITNELKALNEKRIIPWIYDLACSHGGLPLGLLKEQVQFKYFGRAMNWRIQEKVKEWCKDVWQERPDPGQTTLLWCSETIEHCSLLSDIVHSVYKEDVVFDQIIFTTPLGTLDGGLFEIDRPLGHVRTFTTKDLIDFASGNFSGYNWTLYKAPSMVIHGKKQR